MTNQSNAHLHELRAIDWDTVWERFDGWLSEYVAWGYGLPTADECKRQVEACVESQIRQQRAA